MNRHTFGGVGGQIPLPRRIQLKVLFKRSHIVNGNMMTGHVEVASTTVR